MKKIKRTAAAYSLFNALGYTKEELERPLVGVVNSYNDFVFVLFHTFSFPGFKPYLFLFFGFISIPT